jgi:hypothetical protein
VSVSYTLDSLFLVSHKGEVDVNGESECLDEARFPGATKENNRNKEKNDRARMYVNIIRV